MVKPVESERINETHLIQIIKIEQNLTTFKNHVLTSGVAEAMKIWLGQAVDTKMFALEAIFIFQIHKTKKEKVQKLSKNGWDMSHPSPVAPPPL